MDLTSDIIYRGITINAADPDAQRVPGVGAGSGIVGNYIDVADMTDVDVIQFLEKRSQSDGMDAGQPFLGARRIRLAGTLYNVLRPVLFDDLNDLRAAFNPVLAAREEPDDMGYRPLYFSVPTNRIEDYVGGAIPLQVMAMPRGFSAQFTRDTTGGSDVAAMGIPWQVTLVCKDPSILAADPQDFDHTVQTIVTGATGQNAGDTITKTSHGLVADDRIRFTTLTGGTGLSTSITYYVINVVGDTFQVSLTQGGSAVAITANYTDVAYVQSITDSGDFSNRGNYLANFQALWVVGPQSGTIVGSVGDSSFTITVPVSTKDRVIRFKGKDKVLTMQETDGDELPKNGSIDFDNDTTWPLIDPGSSPYSITVHGCVLQTGSHFWFYEQYA